MTQHDPVNPWDSFFDFRRERVGWFSVLPFSGVHVLGDHFARFKCEVVGV
jgi:hypothetical protein